MQSQVGWFTRRKPWSAVACGSLSAVLCAESTAESTVDGYDDELCALCCSCGPVVALLAHVAAASERSADVWTTTSQQEHLEWNPQIGLPAQLQGASEDPRLPITLPHPSEEARLPSL